MRRAETYEQCARAMSVLHIFFKLSILLNDNITIVIKRNMSIFKQKNYKNYKNIVTTMIFNLVLIFNLIRN